MEQDQVNSNDVFCRRCHRKLKDEKSKELGFGKTCYAKYIKKSAMFLFDMEDKNGKD